MCMCFLSCIFTPPQSNMHVGVFSILLFFTVQGGNDLFNSLNVSNEWNNPQKHRVDVIPTMASLNAPSLSTKIGSIRPMPNSPRMEAVVEAEVDVTAEVALLVEAVAMLVIEPTLA